MLQDGLDEPGKPTNWEYIPSNIISSLLYNFFFAFFSVIAFSRYTIQTFIHALTAFLTTKHGVKSLCTKRRKKAEKM